MQKLNIHKEILPFTSGRAVYVSAYRLSKVVLNLKEEEQCIAHKDVTMEIVKFGN